MTDAWRREARLLIDRDGVKFDDAMRVLEWCQQDDFWRTNILSMPTFRKQFDRLRLGSERTTKTAEELKRETDLEASKRRREAELAHAERMRLEAERLKAEAAPAPRCEHDRILALCNLCSKELAGEK